MDKIYRDHCGQQMRLIAPHLPDRGKVKGDERMFSDMIKWRHINMRKARVPGKVSYKKGFTVSRVDCCENALKLIEQQNFPVTLVDSEKRETKFDIDNEKRDIEEVSQVSQVVAAVPMPPSLNGVIMPTVGVTPFFGNAMYLPKPVPVTGPLAPVTASAASVSAAAAFVSSQKRALEPMDPNATTLPQATAPKPKKPKAAPKPKQAEETQQPERTEPVNACTLPAPHTFECSHVALLLTSLLSSSPPLCAQVELFKSAGLPLRPLPRAEVAKGQPIVVRCASMEEDVLVDSYWYGVVGMLTKKGTWIKFYDLDTGDYIVEEKHLLQPKEYYDRWMLVERIVAV